MGALSALCLHPILANNEQKTIFEEKEEEMSSRFSTYSQAFVRVGLRPACISEIAVIHHPAILSPSTVPHSFVCIPFSVIYFSFS